MVAAIVRGFRLLVAGGVPALAALMMTTGSAAASQSDYAKAYALGLQAYTYGLPLVVSDETFRSMTSINVSNGAFGPVNHFNNVRSLNNPNSTAVVAPGANALSSIAWLDLTREPQVLHVPKVRGHFFVLALEDPYTDDFLNLGSVHKTKPGYYVIAGPGQHGVAIPAGAHRIDSNYSRGLDHWVNPTEGQEGPCQRPRIRTATRSRRSASSVPTITPNPPRIGTPPSRTIRCPAACGSSTCSGGCSSGSRPRPLTGPSCASSLRSGSARG